MKQLLLLAILAAPATVQADQAYDDARAFLTYTETYKAQCILYQSGNAFSQFLTTWTFIVENAPAGTPGIPILDAAVQAYVDAYAVEIDELSDGIDIMWASIDPQTQTVTNPLQFAAGKATAWDAAVAVPSVLVPCEELSSHEVRCEVDLDQPLTGRFGRYMPIPETSGTRRGSENRLCVLTYSMLENWTGLKRRTISEYARKGRLDLNDLESVLSWVNEYRATKGLSPIGAVHVAAEQP